MENFGMLWYIQDQWMLEEMPPHVIIRMKQLFPRINKGQTQPFFFPDTPSMCADLVWFTMRYPMEMTQKDRDYLHKQVQSYEINQAQMGAILKPDYITPERQMLREGQVLRHYQAVAADLAFQRKSLLLGDDVGLGKTYSAAGLLSYPQVLPAAVVVQSHLQTQWAEKLGEFTTLQIHQIESTSPYDLPAADVYVFKYSALYGWIDTFEDGFFKAVVYDEVQELRRGSESMKGRGAKVLSEYAEYKLGLSATPIYNYGSEIFNVMEVIDPTVLGEWEEFKREWLIGDKQVKNPEALGSYLREQHVFLRRLATDIGLELPKVNTLVQYVEADMDTVRSIEDRARSLAMRITTGSFTERGQAAREFDLLVRQNTGIAKARSVAACVRMLLQTGKSIVLAGWHRAVYNIWLEELADFKPLMYTGSETQSQKDRMKRAFIAKESTLIILSLRSGVGLDGLQHVCSTVIVGELDWSPKVHDQLLGRVNREGQQSEVDMIYLVADEGADPPMIEVLGIKNAQSHGIVDPGLELGAKHTDDSRIKELATRYLAQMEQSEMKKEGASL